MPACRLILLVYAVEFSAMLGVLSGAALPRVLNAALLIAYAPVVVNHLPLPVAPARSARLGRECRPPALRA
jgi:hypothetical protein